MINPVHSSKSMDWQTPEWFLELVRAVAPIKYDPASTEGNPTGAHSYSTPDGFHLMNGYKLPGTGCGLSAAWNISPEGLVFVNPPYGRHLRGDVDPKAKIRVKGELVGVGTGWVRKMASYEGQALYLVPNRPEADWHHELEDWCDAHLRWCSPTLGKRIGFVRPGSDEPSKGPGYPNSVFYSAGDVTVRTHRKRLRRFREVFEKHGRITIVQK